MASRSMMPTPPHVALKQPIHLNRSAGAATCRMSELTPIMAT